MNGDARILEQGRPAQLRCEAGVLATPATGGQRDPAACHWLPPATGKVICVALNHREHLESLQAELQQPPYGQPPREPVLFIKPPNTLAGHLAPLPEAIGEPLYAGAGLGVVIGQPASRIAADAAHEVIGGYTLFNELSLAEDSFFRPAIRAKCRDGSAAMGPLVVPAGGVDPDAVTLRTLVDGLEVQAFSTAGFRRSTAQLIEAVTAFMQLLPGDVLVTGFARRSCTLVAGQTVTIAAEGLGSLSNRITAEAEWLAWRAAEAA